MKGFITYAFVLLASGVALLLATPQEVFADDADAGGIAEGSDPSTELTAVVRELQDEVRKLRDELAVVKVGGTPPVSAGGEELQITNHSLTPEPARETRSLPVGIHSSSSPGIPPRSFRRRVVSLALFQK